MKICETKIDDKWVVCKGGRFVGGVCDKQVHRLD